MLPEDVLEHFGIPGMKWGRRKSRSSVTPSSGKKVIREDTRSADHKRANEIKKKKVSEMSNEELKALNTRLQLEKQYKDLAKTDISPGKKFVTDLLINSGKQTINRYVQKGAEAAIKKAIGL